MVTVKLKHLFTHSLTKSSAIVFAGTMVGNVSAYLYHLFTGRILGPAQYGELTALLSLLYIINVPTVVIQTIMTKFFSILKARQSFGKAKFLFALAMKRLILLAALGLIVVLPLASAIAGFLHISSSLYVIWLYLIFATTIISIINLSALMGNQRFVAASIYPNVGGVLRLVLGVIGSLFGVGWTLLGNVAANVIAFISYFFSLGFITKPVAVRFDLAELNTGRYSLPAFLSILGITALYSQDVVLVKHFFSPLEAGVYAALSVLGKIIFFASFAVGTVMFPVIAERSEQARPHQRVVLFGLFGVATLSLILTLIYILFPRTVVHALYGAAYDSAVPYLGLFGLFMTFFSLAYLVTNICLALGRTRVWALTILAAAVQAAFIWFFHASLWDIVKINTLVATALFAALLLYYRHARQIS